MAGTTVRNEFALLVRGGCCEGGRIGPECAVVAVSLMNEDGDPQLLGCTVRPLGDAVIHHRGLNTASQSERESEVAAEGKSDDAEAPGIDAGFGRQSVPSLPHGVLEGGTPHRVVQDGARGAGGVRPKAV